MIGFFVATSSFAQDDISEVIVETKHEVAINWSPDFKTALKKSRKEKKPVLIYFTGSDWCGPCKVLDRDLFHTEKFKALSDKNLILLEVDLPRRVDLLSTEKLKENFYLKNKYKVKSFPTMILVNHRGKVVGLKKGVILTEYYYPFFESIIAKY